MDFLIVTDIYNIYIYIYIAEFVYKQKNYILPEIFDNIFKENNQDHCHNTQPIDNIHHKHTNKCGKITTENQETNI